MISEVSIEQRDSWQPQPKYPNTQSNLLIKKLKKIKKKKKKPSIWPRPKKKIYIFPEPSQTHTTNFDYFIIKQKLATLMKAIQGLTQETAKEKCPIRHYNGFYRKTP